MSDVAGEIALAQSGETLCFLCPCGAVKKDISMDSREMVWCDECCRYGFDLSVTVGEFDMPPPVAIVPDPPKPLPKGLIDMAVLKPSGRLTLIPLKMEERR